jgi:hypothetical protein
MQRSDAVRALDIYKRATNQVKFCPSTVDPLMNLFSGLFSLACSNKNQGSFLSLIN